MHVYPAEHDQTEALIIATALEVYARICEARIEAGNDEPYGAHLPTVNALRAAYGSSDEVITDPKLAKAMAAIKRGRDRRRSDAALVTEGMTKD